MTMAPALLDIGFGPSGAMLTFAAKKHACTKHKFR